MKIKKNDNYVNYLLTIGFVLLIISFIVGLTAISRVVLSDSTSIGEHVITTKNLLEDIDEVKMSAQDDSINNSKIYTIDNNNYLEINNGGYNITDLSYLNINENKSIFTLMFDSEINNVGGVYYLDIKNITELKKGTVISYERENIIRLGNFVEFNDELIIVDFYDKQKIINIKYSEVLGRVILIKND